MYMYMISMDLAAAGSRRVNAEKGLRLREAPSESAQIVILIPHKSDVAFLEGQDREVTIAGVRGKWTRISWEGRTGWVPRGGMWRGNALSGYKTVFENDGECGES